MPLADLDLLRARLELAMASRGHRRGGVAVLAVQVHRQGDPGPTDPRAAAALAEPVQTRLLGCLEPVDTVTRNGDLGFFVLLERIDEGPFAVHVADRILEAMRTPFEAGGGQASLVASIGISLFPNDAEAAQELLERADAAKTAAQMGGGDFFGFYSGHMNEQAGRRIEIERALVGVLERGELELHFQPQIDTRDGSLMGVEALLRWNNRKLGAVSPGELIPVLEAGGGMREVGAWVLEQACAQGAEWARQGQPTRIAVNVSARQLRGDGFEPAVVSALDRSGLDPRLLELELTESVLVDNPRRCREMLQSLRQRGIRLAMDDFGTGFASLATIRQFPLDTLKIDREFVRGLPVDNENAAITSAIVALGRSLGLEVVAEGVEEEAEEEFLHSLGCHLVQGYRHARPMPREQLAEWRGLRPWA